jgi:hypothetical protein
VGNDIAAMKPRITGVKLDTRRMSFACEAPGVVMVVLAVVLPPQWHPVPLLFAGLALIAVSHVLTPCRDQITRWWRARISKSSPDRT